MVPRISAAICVEYVVEEAMMMQSQRGRVLREMGMIFWGAGSEGQILDEESVSEYIEHRT